MLLFWPNCGLSATSCCGVWVPSDDESSGSDEDEHSVWSRVLGLSFHFDFGERFQDCVAEG